MQSGGGKGVGTSGLGREGMIAELAAAIATDGVRNVFGIPGGGASLELIDALEQAGVAFHTTHFEGSAAMMAGASGRVRGRAGVALSIKGPGLANMVPGLAFCKLESLPVVAAAESYSPNETTRAHKRMDHQGLVSAVTKGSWFLDGNGSQFVRLARHAEDEPPGPILLNLAIDEGA